MEPSVFLALGGYADGVESVPLTEKAFLHQNDLWFGIVFLLESGPSGQERRNGVPHAQISGPGGEKQSRSS